MVSHETAIVLCLGGHKGTTLLGDFSWLWVCQAESLSKLSAVTITADYVVQRDRAAFHPFSA
jgi:hypothetical protein